jgi:hypothetical protein
MDDVTLRLVGRNACRRNLTLTDEPISHEPGGYDKMIICKAVEERICRKIDLASRDDLTLQQAVDALLLLLKIVRQNNLSVDISSAEKLLLSRSI